MGQLRFWCHTGLKFKFFGAVGETRTLMDIIHTALNRACLPISARPQLLSTFSKLVIYDSLK